MVEREVVREHGRVTMGWFRCRPGQDGFDGGAVDRPIVVFPRTAVAIRHADRDEVVADPTVAMFYNRGDTYHRRSIDPVGDRCEWLSVPDEWWAEVCEVVDPAHRASRAHPDRGRVFTRDHGPAPATTYLRQRHLTGSMAAGTACTLAVEEAALAVIRDVVAATAGVDEADPARTATTRGRHRRLVRDTCEYLAATWADDDSLADTAAAVGASPFHLSRIFRAHTGTTIHQHRTQLRLRAGLGRLGTTDPLDLAGLALDLGFANHSHFTATFRRAFGVAPSKARTMLTA